MKNDRELDDGMLDGAGRSRRFIQPYKHEERIEEQQRKAQKKNKSHTKNKINDDIKYGNKKNSIPEYNALTTAEQLRIAAGFQQAILKVTSYGKGVNKILQHIAYITRNFDLPLEDQDQSLLKSSNDASDLLSSWQSIYFDKKANSRDTVHLVFSAPPGTCRNTFKELTREFLSEQYEGEHDYLFVQHDDTEHPHIHSVICLRSINGQKLDPRKKYLHELRKQFAEKCRDNGIMLDSSKRFERGLSGKSVKSEFVHMREKRKIIPQADKQLIARVKSELNSDIIPPNTGESVRKTRNQNIKNHFYKTAKKLYETYMNAAQDKRQDKDIKAAKLLFDYSKTIPGEMTRSEYLKERLINGSSQAFGKTSDFIELDSLLKPKQTLSRKVDMGIGDDE